MLTTVVHAILLPNLLLQLPPPLPRPFSSPCVPPPKFAGRTAVWRHQLPGVAVTFLRTAPVVAPPLRLTRRQSDAWRRQRRIVRGCRRRVQGCRARCTRRRGSFTGEFFEGSNFGPVVQKQAVRRQTRVGAKQRCATGRHAFHESMNHVLRHRAVEVWGFRCEVRARCDAAHLAAADRDSGCEGCWRPAATASSTTREAAAPAGSSIGALGALCAESARSMLCSTAS
jgi:hypothetical protein